MRDVTTCYGSRDGTQKHTETVNSSGSSPLARNKHIAYNTTSYRRWSGSRNPLEKPKADQLSKRLRYRRRYPKDYEDHVGNVDNGAPPVNFGHARGKQQAGRHTHKENSDHEHAELWVGRLKLGNDLPRGRRQHGRGHLSECGEEGDVDDDGELLAAWPV